jgi:hypothetical protein
VRGLSLRITRSRGLLGKVSGRVAHLHTPRRISNPPPTPGFRFMRNKLYYSADWLNWVPAPMPAQGSRDK